MISAVVIVAVAVIAFCFYVNTRPDSFRLGRSVSINAAPEKVFALINDFREWSKWSPWDKIDPALKRSFSGPPSGVGTVYEWLGNSKVGMGRMEITHASAASKITIQLDFLKPFEAHNTAEFTLAPEGNATRATWAMFGPNNFMAKLMQIFVSMDKMVGGDFEKGLASMKTAAEQ